MNPTSNGRERSCRERGVEFAYHQLKFAPFEKVAEATRDADVVIVNMVPVTRELVATWTKCKLVIRHGVGYDNVDISALDGAGIPLCYIPDYCVEEVAEQAIALHSRLRPPHRHRPAGRSKTPRRTASGISRKPFRFSGWRGRSSASSGCGRIGSRVYEKLKSFGFEFLIYDPYLSAERKRELGIQTVDQRDALPASRTSSRFTPR